MPYLEPKKDEKYIIKREKYPDIKQSKSTQKSQECA
jgi:hypothetical protein